MPESTSPSPRQDRAVRTRARLLEAAVAVIQRDGSAGLSLDKVAAEAGVSKGGLLYHFRSKDELVAALLDRTLTTAGANLDQRTEEFGDGVGAFATAYIEFMREPYEPSGDDDIASSILAAASLDKRLLADTDMRFQRWQQRMLEDGLDPGLALLVRIASDGLWLIDTFRLAPLTPHERGQVVDLLEELIEDGIAANDPD